MNINTFVFNPFYENTFIIWDENSKEAAIIDPGCSDKSEEDSLDEFIKKNDLIINYMINTHCHIDHIMGNAYIKEKYTPEFLAPEKDLFLLDNAAAQAENFGMEIRPSPKPDKYITEQSIIKLGSAQGEFLFTPGHTPGEFCLYFPVNKICITGDVLFFEGIGRTDLWGGDYNILSQSIKSRLFTLPDNVTIYPGHGETSTIGHEKSFNPFL